MAKQFNLYFMNEKYGVLILPDSLTRADFDLLKLQLDHALWVVERAFVEEPKAPVAPPEEINAEELGENS